ncbi:unnamed protein product [Eruca vesicaria subsp. sativa]|uniref:BTB domain-containing protein n=1 Tax=Eruca vesicaria subsp. sativa TaxID=29727 RepID=A0ABC8J123_ERUVS|nr:unnamed protein product [Eruca vesicaria subsp. sativa]
MSTSTKNIPKPPPLPRVTYQRFQASSTRKPSGSSRLVPKEAVETWDKVLQQALGADTVIQTEGNFRLSAHSTFLSAASPVLANLLDQSRDSNGKTYLINLPAVPFEVAYIFLRFLYTSWYVLMSSNENFLAYKASLMIIHKPCSLEEEEMNKCAFPLMLLSHWYSIPSLKRVCIEFLSREGHINRETVLDMLQLARGCDATRLSFLCISMVIKDFEAISLTEAWKEMKESDPLLEQELEAVFEAQTERQERRLKLEEKKTYLEVYEALEALVHIYREGCVTIGPRDKPLKEGRGTVCEFRFCKGVESALRHFLGCKSRASCSRCKRMWQLFQLHACVCDDSDSCDVPLCRSLMEKREIRKKYEYKLRLLAEKVVTAKNSLGPFSARLFALFTYIFDTKSDMTESGYHETFGYRREINIALPVLSDDNSYNFFKSGDEHSDDSNKQNKPNRNDFRKQ